MKKAKQTKSLLGMYKKRFLSKSDSIWTISACDSDTKDIMRYIRVAVLAKKEKKIDVALRAMEVINAICNNSIDKLQDDNAMVYLKENF